MPSIVALLQPIAPLLEPTTVRQLSQVLFGMLVISGRLTMLGLSRWTEKGGSYRTIQRLYHSVLPWTALHWAFFRKRLLKPDDEYIIAGDEVVVSKAGKKTHGLDRFFSGVQQQVIPSLSFFTLSLVNVQDAQSSPLQVTQTVKSAEEKAASKAKAEAKKVKKTTEPAQRGRPKGSKNKAKQTVVLNPELVRIQTALHSLLETVGTVIPLKYAVMDGHFGNYPSAFMVRQANLHLISKLRCDAALYPAFDGEYSGRGPKPKYGPQLDARHLEAKYLKATSIENRVRTDIYQGQFYNKEFAFPLNVVVILKTNLETQTQAHVILFSTDLEQPHDKIIKFYSLRFQIEFNFRDAKQYWGLEDFMNVTPTAVTNAANLSLFMVNFAYCLLRDFRQTDPSCSVLDLKAYFRAYKYVEETLKMLPETPEPIFVQQIFSKVAHLGRIHSVEPYICSP